MPFGKAVCPCIWLRQKTIDKLNGTWNANVPLTSVFGSPGLDLKNDQQGVYGCEVLAKTQLQLIESRETEMRTRLITAAGWLSAPFDCNFFMFKGEVEKAGTVVREAYRMARRWRKARNKKAATASPLGRPPGLDGRFNLDDGTFLKRVLRHLRSTGVPLVPAGAQNYIPSLWPIHSSELNFKQWVWDKHAKTKPPAGIEGLTLEIDNSLRSAPGGTILNIRFRRQNEDNRNAPFIVKAVDSLDSSFARECVIRAAHSVEVLLCYVSLLHLQNERRKKSEKEIPPPYKDRKKRYERQAAPV